MMLAQLPFFTLASLLVAFFVVRTALVQGLQHALDRHPFFKKRRIFHAQPAPGQMRRELIANGFVVVTEGLFWAVALHFGLAGKDGGNIIASFVVCLVWWDISFYISHRALHTKLLFPLHRQYHRARINTAFSGASFSIAEALFLMTAGWGPLLALSHWWGMSYLGVFAFHEFFSVLRTTGHFNSEFYPQFWVRSKWFNWMQTTTFHALHHSRSRGHFGLFTVIPDRLMNTAFADYEDVHDRAFNGDTSASELASAPVTVKAAA